MSSKSPLDQYFTSPIIAEFLSEKVKERFGDSKYVEPSAGAGAFSRCFHSIESYDLEPKFNGCKCADFLEVDFGDVDDVVFVGNPPFGKNSSLAVKFFNKCARNAKAICFILPKTFRKLGFHDRLDSNFWPTYECEIPDKSFILNGEPYDVPCVFQIWERRTAQRAKFDPPNPWFEEVTPELATFCVRRAGGKAGMVLCGLDHSPSSTYFFREKIPGVKYMIETLGSRLKEEASNTAGVRSISKREIAHVLNLYFR